MSAYIIFKSSRTNSIQKFVPFLLFCDAIRVSGRVRQNVRSSEERRTTRDNLTNRLFLVARALLLAFLIRSVLVSFYPGCVAP